MFIATMKNVLSAPGLDVWGTAAWTGRDTGYLDLQMRWYLLEESLGKGSCLGSCSLSPSGP